MTKRRHESWSIYCLAAAALNRAVRLVVIVVAFYGALGPLAAFAQHSGAGIEAQKSATEPSYVLPYFLVVLCIGLGLLVVGRPSRRKDPQEREDRPA